MKRILSLFLFLLSFGAVWLGLIDTSNINRLQDKERVEESIHKALVECYSCEGFYPEELSYLENHYGLFINQEQYFVSYEYEGENIMPQVYVYQKGKSA